MANGFQVSEATAPATRLAMQHTRTYTLSPSSVKAFEAMVDDALQVIQSYGLDPASIELQATYSAGTTTAMLAFVADR